MVNKTVLKELHPCFGSKQNKGRIHLPVCHNCNIQCNFCDRQINDIEDRPGVTNKIISPYEALDIVTRAVEKMPDITVVGIAGPGDTLASNQAMETFFLVKKYYPNLLTCMSTNGLLLYERSEELLDIGIDTVTVTVNGVDPKVVSNIVSWVQYHDQFFKGEEAAEILIENQIKGIEKLTKAGVTVKVNTVYISEINKEHIKEIAQVMQKIGVSIFNIIPLIPNYKLSHCNVPTCLEIESARGEASEYMDVFRHCMRCRADAIGIPGGMDISREIYQEPISYRETFSHG